MKKKAIDKLNILPVKSPVLLLLRFHINNRV